jgi:prepilin-type processing-associated H-X9-DG protein
MGRQSVDEQGNTNSRIGYRHPGPKGAETMANAGFADGHVEAIEGDKFPCALSNGTSDPNYLIKKTQNMGGPTVYANPDAIFTK